MRVEKYCPKCFRKYPPDTARCSADGSYLVSPMDKDLTGAILDERYTVLERIGRGGMGVVYKAEQHLIKRIVALKVLRRDIVQDESAVKRFLNEARAIASLDSRHTVTLHDFGVTQDGLLYYTMELLKGRPLSRIIRDEAPLVRAGPRTAIPLIPTTIATEPSTTWTRSTVASGTRTKTAMVSVPARQFASASRTRSTRPPTATIATT